MLLRNHDLPNYKNYDITKDQYILFGWRLNLRPPYTVRLHNFDEILPEQIDYR